jgi:hypothetical protein
MVKRIRDARTPEETLDLVRSARGPARTAWEDRMRGFGPQVVPMISERLKTARHVRPKPDRDSTIEGLIGELRWRGDAGGQVLMERFNDLSSYGRGLACVVLGLLGAQSSADLMWSFYQRAVRDPRESYFVGALWGLIDLKDERVVGALTGLLSGERTFPELFGFLALAGDASSVLPLLAASATPPAVDQMPATMALAAVAHRIGQDALLAEFAKVSGLADLGDAQEDLVDTLLASPASVYEEYFALFFRGLTSDDMEVALSSAAMRGWASLATTEYVPTGENPHHGHSGKP